MEEGRLPPPWFASSSSTSSAPSASAASRMMMQYLPTPQPPPLPPPSLPLPPSGIVPLASVSTAAGIHLNPSLYGSLPIAQVRRLARLSMESARIRIPNQIISRIHGMAVSQPPPVSVAPTAHISEQSKLDLAPKMSIARADNSTQCSICLDNISLKAIVHSCFHQFCHMCIFEWYKGKGFCPVCRQVIQKIMYNIQSDIKYDECYLPIHPLEDNLFEESRYRLTIHVSGTNNEPIEHQIAFLPRLRDLNESTPQRTVQVGLYQMLATLHEKHPELGFPTARIDYQKFSDASPPVQTDPQAMLDHFRCFIYLHNYVPVNKCKMVRSVNLKFFQDNPSLTHRLVIFVKSEIQAFRRVYQLSPVENALFDQLMNSLQNIELCSETFRLRFEQIFFHNLPMNQISPHTHHLTDNLYQELVCFAQSPFSDHRDYILNMQYMMQNVVVYKPMEPPKSENNPSSQNQQGAVLMSPATMDGDTTPRVDVSSPGTSHGQYSSSSTSRTNEAVPQQPQTPVISSNETLLIELSDEEEEDKVAVASNDIECITIPTSSESDSSDSFDASDSVEWIPPTEFYTNTNEEAPSKTEPDVDMTPLLENEPNTSPSALASPATSISTNAVSTIPIELLKPGPSGLHQAAVVSDDSDVICIEAYTRTHSKRSYQQYKNGQYPAGSRFAKASFNKRYNKRAKRSTNGSSPKRFTKQDVMDMRRVLRLAPHSAYFYRQLLHEVRRKFCHFDSILNTGHFAHLEDFFTDVYCNARLFCPRTLTDDFGHSKRAFTPQEFQRMLDANSPRNKVFRRNRSGRLCDDPGVAPDSDSDELDQEVVKYERENLEKINQMVMGYVTSQTKLPTRQLMVYLQQEKIQFTNHLYTDDEDDIQL